MRSVLLLGLFSLIYAAPVQGLDSFVCHGHIEGPPQAAAKSAIRGVMPSSGTVYALVVHADFPGRSGGAAPFSRADYFDPEEPGSLRHFFRTMSFGQFDLDGEVLPRRYAGGDPSSAYLNEDAGRAGDFHRFALEVVQAVDRDVDFGRFDNDGPDGIPNSGDDDGVVDYIFINMRSVPRGFIIGGATGKAGLGFAAYESDDAAAGGGRIAVRGDTQYGSILQEGNLAQTVGVMAHEFGHAFALPDLYDTRYEDPESDSAGIGKWGLMGHGSLGWDGRGGPVGFSAWSLEKLGWIGPGNSRLEELWQDRDGYELRDLFEGGSVLKIPLPPRAPRPDENLKSQVFGIPKVGYLLLEARRTASHYYNRGMPGEGVLVWHVRPGTAGNSDERESQVDLVCADGLYADGGFGTGQVGAPSTGGDNLDFWAHDASYRRARGGNRGDGGDPFDGVRHRRFWSQGNPSVGSVADFSPAALSPLDVKLDRRGSGWVADVEVPNWAGRIDEEVGWRGTVLVDGDLEVGSKGTVKVYPGTRVLFAPGDRLGVGVDPQAIELLVRGGLELPFSAVRDPVSFEAMDPKAPWYGVRVETSASTAVQVPPNGLRLLHASQGLSIDGEQVEEMGLKLRRVEILDAPGDQLAGNGDGRLQGGETFRLALEVVNWSLHAYAGERFKLAWGGRQVGGQWAVGVRSMLHGERSDLLTGQVLRLEMPALTLDPDAEGTLDFSLELANFDGWSEEFSLPVRQGPAAGGVLMRVDGAELASKVSLPVAREPVRIEAEVGEGVEAVDLVLRRMNGSEFYPPVPLAAVEGRPGLFRGSFTPEGSVIYEAVPRLYSGGSARLSDTRLWINPLVDAWQPNLVVWDRAHSEADRAFMRAVLQDLGLEFNEIFSYDRDLGRRFSAEQILRHYIGRGSNVIWLSDDIAPGSESALLDFAGKGGRLLVASRNLHPRLRAGDFKTRLLADGLETRDQTTVPALRGDGALNRLEFNARHSVFTGVESPAVPLVYNGKGEVAGIQVDAADFKAVYLAFDLEDQEEGVLRALLDNSLKALGGGPVSAAPRVVGVAGITAFAGLDPLQPRVIMRNGTDALTPRLRVGYRVKEGDAVLATRAISAPGLAPGEERELVLPLWRPPHEADYSLEFGLADGDEAFGWKHALQVVNARGVFDARPLDGGTRTNGAGFFDADGDGDLDLYLVRLGEPNRLLGNTAGQLQHLPATGLEDGGQGRGLAVGDYDGDGDLDVYLVNEGANRFYRNHNGVFLRHEDPGLEDEGSGRSAGFFDYDGDGDLDLYLVNSLSANRLYRNDDGSFAEVAAQLGVGDGGQGRGLAVGDYDGDGDPDLLVANQGGSASRLYRNDGEGFSDVALAAGLDFSGSEVAGVFGDYDGDGHADIFLSSQSDPNALWRNQGDGSFERVDADLGENSVGAAFFDYDNDGDLDLASTALNVSLGGDQLYHNRGAQGFVPVGPRLGLRQAAAGRAMSFGDIDGDGRQDLVVADYEEAQLYRNQLQAAGWLQVALRGQGLNTKAVGARVEVFSNGVRQVRELQSSYGYGSQVQPQLHFGVGDVRQVDSLKVTWPDGLESLRRGVFSNQKLLLNKPLSGLPAKAVPRQLTLEDNHPNPFNAETAIGFSLPAAGKVDLAVYDALGQRVRTLVNGEKAAGRYRAVWDGRDGAGRGVGSGVYFYRLEAAGNVLAKKLLLLK